MSDDKKQLGRVQLRRGDDPDPQAEVEELRKLSEQHGVPGIDLGQICVRLDDLELLPREIAERRLILPVLVRDDRVFVAMTNPGDEKLIDELEFVTGKRVFPYVALATTLERVIAAAYDGKVRNERFYVGPRCPPEIQRKMGVVSEPRDEVEPPAPDVFPDAPAARVAGERVAAAAERDELSYNDLGNTNPELSVVTEVPAPSPSTPPLSPTKKTILVVDDEADIRKILLRVLGTKGYKVLEADRGLEALRMVKAHMPDLLLLDAMLPEVHGFEIARRIKGSQKYGHIPIIMVSAVYKGAQYAEDARQSYGVDAYIEKPFRIAEIVDAVEAALSGKKGEAPPAAAPEPPPRRDPEEVSAEAEACLNAGVAAWQAGDLELAIEHLRRGVALDPLAFRLHFHLGLLYGKKGMVYEAIAELEAAAEQNPKHFPVLKNLAVLYQKAGFKTKAVTAWERAAELAPDQGTRATIRGHIETLRLASRFFTRVVVRASHPDCTVGPTRRAQGARGQGDTVMIGFIISAACAYGLFRVVKRSRWRGLGWGSPRRALYRYLDTTAGQEKELSPLLDELFAAGGDARDDARQARRDIAAALRGERVDEATLARAFASLEQKLQHLREVASLGVTRAHEILEPDQRRRLASAIEHGPRGAGRCGHHARWSAA